MRGLEIDDQFEFGRLQNRQVGRFGAIENLSSVNANLVIGIGEIGPVANQTPVCSKITRKIHHGNRMLRRQCDESSTAANEECINSDHERIDPTFDKASE